MLDSTKSALVHRCKFVDYQPVSIKHIACVPIRERLVHATAVLRENGIVEICEASSRWIPQRRIHIYGAECLCWTPSDNAVGVQYSPGASWPRLYVGTVGGSVAEVDCNDFMIKISEKSLDRIGAIWSLAASSDGKTLAVGGEGGCVQLYCLSRADGSACFEYIRTLEVQSGRILGLAWDAQDSLIAGCNDLGHVQLWDPQTGRSLGRMFTGKRGESSIVWSVAFCTLANTLVTGDSLGQVCFWNCKTQTLISSFRRIGDVLAVAASDKFAFASGSDGSVTRYDWTNGGWTEKGSLRYHSHDVRSLQVSQNGLFSGGMDCSLAILGNLDKSFNHSDPGTNVLHLSPFPSAPTVQIGDRLIVSTSSCMTKIKVWSLGKNPTLADTSVEIPPQLLLDIVVTSNRDPIKQFDISSDGRTIVAVTFGGLLKVYRINHILMDSSGKYVEDISLGKCHFPTTENNRFAAVTVLNDEQIVAVCYDDQKKEKFACLLQVSSTSANEQNQLEMVSVLSYPCYEEICHVTSNQKPSLVAFSHLDKTVCIVDFSKKQAPKILHKQQLPTLLTCLKFLDPFQLLAITDDNNFYVYKFNSDGSSFLPAFGSTKLPSKWTNRNGPIIGISAPIKESPLRSLNVWSNQWIGLVFLDLAVPSDEDIVSRHSKKQKLASNNGFHNFSISSQYACVLAMSHIPHSDEVVIVELPWTEILASLPQALYRKRFGAQ